MYVLSCHFTCCFPDISVLYLISALTAQISPAQISVSALSRRLYDLSNFLRDHIQRTRCCLNSRLLNGRFLFSTVFFFSGSVSSSYGVQENIATDIGARLMAIEFFLVSHSSFFDILTLGFVIPLPPNCFASLFRISLYFPANGTPRRNFSCSTGAKLQTKSRVSSGFPFFSQI